MANLFEQYEQAAQRAANVTRPQRPIRPELSATGFISATVDEEEPIFTKQKIYFKPTDSITHLVVSNNQLALTMANKVLLRIDQHHADQPDEININAQVSHLFLDPNGQHILAGLTGKEYDTTPNTVYLNRTSKKFKHGNKMKGVVITAVAWNPTNTKENTTGPILIGTSKGLIIETELVSSEDRNHIFQTNIEQYWKQVFDVGRGYPGLGITGLEFHKFPNSDSKYFIMATTPSRFYQFVGNIIPGSDPPLLQNIFYNYLDVPERFQEIPGNLGYSQLQLYCNPPGTVPKTFAWMTGAGVYCGAIDCVNQTGQDSVTKDSRLLQYPIEKEQSLKPLAIVVTEFNILVMFKDRLKAICILNEQVVFEDVFVETFGRLVGITKDPIKETIFAFAERAVYKYKVIKEARNVWQVYLAKGDYAKAKQYCKDNPANLDKVITCQAQDLFDKKEYEKSAMHYATTQVSFEEVTLKFLECGESKALKIFLIKKMESLKPQEKTQLTMIVTWLIEIYMKQLGLMRDSDIKVGSADYSQLRQEFYQFLDLAKVKDCVSNNRNTVYDLMSSHGDQESLIHFTVLLKDFERVIRYHIQHGKLKEALAVLQKQNNMELFYMFSPELMQSIPELTVDVWIAQGRKLNQVRLIPALVQYDHDQHSKTGLNQENEAIRYLEFCVQTLDSREQAIHNYLLSMYVTLKPIKLMAYLKSQGQDASTVCYDLKYALRLCSEYNHTCACVHIYTTMGLFEEAVDLALKEEKIDLAKENADRPEDNNELRKKLWLKIACHVVAKEKTDIKKAMEFLQECDLIKIEDILPFFPDFVTIDHFKDAICTSLRDYNEHIETLKAEMEETTESSKEIRAEIQAFRNRFAVVSGQDKCSVCSYPVLTRAFYLFPCRHLFHFDCLVSEVLPHLSKSKRQRVDDINRQLASHRDELSQHNNNAQTNVVNTSLPVLGKREQLKAELDDLIAEECIYCGEIMIKSIDAPFIEQEEYDDVMQGWE